PPRPPPPPAATPRRLAAPRSTRADGPDRSPPTPRAGARPLAMCAAVRSSPASLAPRVAEGPRRAVGARRGVPPPDPTTRLAVHESSRCSATSCRCSRDGGSARRPCSKLQGSRPMQELAAQARNPVIAWLVLGAGAVLLLVTLVAPLRALPRAVQSLRGRTVSESGDGPLWLPLAAATGMGSIVGGVLAMATGGPGALVWMWIATVLGMAIAFAEASLS